MLTDEKPGLDPRPLDSSLLSGAGDSPMVGDPSPVGGSSNGRIPALQAGDAGSIPALSTTEQIQGPSSSGRIPGCDPGEGGSTPPGPSKEPSKEALNVVEEFLAGYNVSDDGGAYVILAPAFFKGKSTVFADRVKDFSQVLWDVRSGKIKPSRSKQTT